MLQRLKGLLKRRGFELYTKPMQLNIVGLRNKDMAKSDELHVFYKINSRNWNYHVYELISDTAKVWKGKPSKTPVLLMEGQYKDAYRIGKRDDETDALLQVKPVDVAYNFDRDALFTDVTTGKQVSGIDLIAATYDGESVTISKAEEGCQIILGSENFSEFMNLCQLHSQLNGNSFTYSLIDFRNSNTSFKTTAFLRGGIKLAMGALAGMVLETYYKKYVQKKKNKEKNNRENSCLVLHFIKPTKSYYMVFYKNLMVILL